MSNNEKIIKRIQSTLKESGISESEQTEILKDLIALVKCESDKIKHPSSEDPTSARQHTCRSDRSALQHL